MSQRDFSEVSADSKCERAVGCVFFASVNNYQQRTLALVAQPTRSLQPIMKTINSCQQDRGGWEISSQKKHKVTETKACPMVHCVYIARRIPKLRDAKKILRPGSACVQQRATRIEIIN